MTARDFALLELDRRALPNWPANSIRPDRRPTGDVADPRDRALGERIYIGVVKNLLRLQHLLVHYSHRPLHKIEPLVQKIACVGLQQIGYLDQVPAAAAVDEAVKQAKALGVASSASFLNAVLRNATREPPPAEPTDPRRYADRVLSHPPELFDRYVQLVGGDVEQAKRLCAHANAEPPTIVRLFAGVDPKQLETAQDVAVNPHEQPGLFVARGAKQPVLAEWAVRALAQVQDPTAAAVADRCDVRPGMTVLDRCAGLGTKTLQLAERAGDGGVVYAVDPS
ncbi:MAG TPA: transcription antitermination factor NusB, partial [Tepidisphaeraceae bacterium]|nr:transcription antitermination factor NusB [Tepidisphaeraceae bacterium]